MKLSGFEKRWARVVGRALFPKGVLGGTTDDADLGAGLEEYLGLSAWWTAVVLRLALWVVWLSPPFFLRRAATFGGLSETDREECLERVLVSRSYSVRELSMLLKMGFCATALGTPAALAHVGAYRLSTKGRAA